MLFGRQVGQTNILTGAGGQMWCRANTVLHEHLLSLNLFWSFPGESVIWSVTLSDFHCVGFFGPVQSVRRPNLSTVDPARNAIYFLKAMSMTNSFQISKLYFSCTRLTHLLSFMNLFSIHHQIIKWQREGSPHLEILGWHGRMTKMHLLKLCPFFFVDFD